MARFQEDVAARSQSLTAFGASRAHDLCGFIARLVDDIAEIQGRSADFVCLFAGSTVNMEFEELARALRTGQMEQMERDSAKQRRN